jgi:murein DD-endopeptidase MepM/ murein hydrolase activator NlpD
VPAQESVLVGGARKWGQTAIAAVTASVGALALIAGTGAPLATASSGPAITPPAYLTNLVADAKAELTELAARVQTAHQQIALDQLRTGQERHELSALVSVEYTGAPDGLLSVLASPDFSSALDTQLELAQLTQAERQLLLKLAQNVRAEEATEAQLKQEQLQEQATENRLNAEELAAEFQEEQAAAAKQAAQAAAAKAAAAGTPGPTPPPSTPTPAPIPTPTPGPPAPPAPGGTGGPFGVNTNLTLPSGISLGQIQTFLQGTPLEADASYFLQAEQTNHVSAIYLIADAVLETGFGTSQIYQQDHNLFGFEAYTSDPGDAMSFPSDQACIAYVSWYVSVNYLTPPGSQVPPYGSPSGTPPSVPTGQFYHGPTPAGMNVDYATDQSWSLKIAVIGSDLQTTTG